jgi:hypothetical protein
MLQPSPCLAEIHAVIIFPYFQDKPFIAWGQNSCPVAMPLSTVKDGRNSTCWQFGFNEKGDSRAVSRYICRFKIAARNMLYHFFDGIAHLECALSREGLLIKANVDEIAFRLGISHMPLSFINLFACNVHAQGRGATTRKLKTKSG